MAGDTAWIARACQLHLAAAKRGVWNGKTAADPYFQQCRQVHQFAGVVSLFTRDVGHHSSGWFKNPDYERCLHLSVSYFDPGTRESRPHDKSVTRQFVDSLFGHHKRWLWVEPPYSDEGKRQGVFHYRLFCDAGWNPITPRGEVYDKELTEAGWLSFSDAQEAETKVQREQLRRMIGG